MNRSARRTTVWLLLVPALLFYLALVLWPILQSFHVSLFRWQIISPSPDRFVALDNYVRLSADPIFWKALSNNALLVVLSLAVQLPMALFLAVLLSGRVFARGFFRTAFFTPMILPTVVIGVLWTQIYLSADFGGLAVTLLDALGFDTPKGGFLEHRDFTFLAVFLTISWRYVGFHMVLYMAGIESIPEELYEATRIDGAGAWQRFRHVTLPLLSPVIRISAVLSIVGSLKYFDLVWVMTRGDLADHASELMTTYMYRHGIRGGHLGYGSAIAVGGFLVSLLVIVPLMHLRWGGAATRERRPGVFLRLMRWTATYGVLVAVAVAGLVLAVRHSSWIVRFLPYAAAALLAVILVPVLVSKGLARLPSLRRRVALTLKYVLLALIVVVSLYPLFWMFTTAVRTSADVLREGMWALPSSVNWANLDRVINHSQFPRYILNSAIVTSASVLLTLAAASLAAFAFARLRFFGRSACFFLFLAGMMIPIHIVLIPLLKMFGSLQLAAARTLAEASVPYARADMLLAVIEQGSLVVTYVAFSLPISIFILKGFFESVPDELVEAARIDGCSTLGVFRHVMLPLAKPAIAVVIIFNCVTLWNEFIFALTLLRTPALFTIPPGMYEFAEQEATNYPLLCAGLAVAVLPMLLLYVLAQKHVIRGLTSGALKG